MGPATPPMRPGTSRARRISTGRATSSPRRTRARSFLLAPPDQVAAALARAGVDDGTTIVVYDDSLSIFAARTWWSLRVYGFEAVRILDGGIAEWIDEGRQLSNANGPAGARLIPPAWPVAHAPHGG